MSELEQIKKANAEFIEATWQRRIARKKREAEKREAQKGTK